MSTVLSDKQKSDHLSRAEAKRQKLNATKKQRTPNTTQSECGFSVIHKLDAFDSLKEGEKKDKRKNDLEKYIKRWTDILTSWNKLIAKK